MNAHVKCPICSENKTIDISTIYVTHYCDVCENPFIVNIQTSSPYKRNEKKYFPISDVFMDLKKMHDKFDFPRDIVDEDFIKFRLDFLQEEVSETRKAFDSVYLLNRAGLSNAELEIAIEDIADEIVDGIIDEIVVCAGFLDLYNVNPHLAWNEVMDANMTKQRANNGKREGSGGFDLVKPEGWKKPSHKNNLGNLPKVLKSIYFNLVKSYAEKSSSIFESEKISKYKDPDMSSVFFDKGNVQGTVQYYDEVKKVQDTEREASKVLRECIELMRSKGEDYQSKESPVVQSDYYIFGILSLFDMLHTKYTRVKSLVFKQLAGGDPNHDSLEDSLKDLINYSSFMVEYIRGGMQGQSDEVSDFNELGKYLKENNDENK